MDPDNRLPPAQPVKLNSVKEKDVRSLFRFLESGHIAWYEKVFRKSHESSENLIIERHDK
jgi:hypothetical protein